MSLLIPKKWLHFFFENSTPDFLFIRQSGDPINAKEFKQLITGDIKNEKQK